MPNFDFKSDMNLRHEFFLVMNQFSVTNYRSLHYRPKVTLLCSVDQVVFIDIIITSKLIVHELFVIVARSKVYFTLVITS